MEKLLNQLIFRYEEHLIKAIEWNLKGEGWCCWETMEYDLQNCIKFRKELDNDFSFESSIDILRIHECSKDFIAKYVYEVEHHDDDPTRCPGW